MSAAVVEAVGWKADWSVKVKQGEGMRMDG